MLYEILIRFDDAGKLKGAHAIEKDINGKSDGPRPIQDSDWPSIVQGVNTVAINQALDFDKVKAENATKQAALDEMQKPATQKRIEELQTQKAAIEEELTTLSNS